MIAWRVTVDVSQPAEGLPETPELSPPRQLAIRIRPGGDISLRPAQRARSEGHEIEQPGTTPESPHWSSGDAGKPSTSTPRQRRPRNDRDGP